MDVRAALEEAIANGSVAAALDYPVVPVAPPYEVSERDGESEESLDAKTRQMRRDAERTGADARMNAVSQIGNLGTFTGAMLMNRMMDDQGVMRLWREMFTGPNRRERRANARLIDPNEANRLYHKMKHRRTPR